MKRKLSIVTVVMLLVGMMVIPGHAAIDEAAYGLLSGAVYTVKNIETGLFLGVENGSVENGGRVLTESANGGDSQQWQVNIEKRTDTDVYVSLASSVGQWMLTVQEDEATGITGLVQTSYTGNEDQLFRLIQDGTGNRYGLESLSGYSLQDGSGSNSAYWEVTLETGKKSHDDVMRYWAPNVYQDFNATYDFLWKYDYITAFDFDGDWVGNNNWENADSGSKVPYIYTSLQETASHYFLTYNFFHPRDVGNIGGSLLAADSHENDMEGALFVIKKDSTDYGSLEVVYTIQHGGYATYAGGDIHYGNNGRVDLFISSNGPVVSGDGISQHGHCVHMWDGSNAQGGILYSYNQTADDNGTLAEASWQPQQDNEFVGFDYGLRSLDDLWDRRFEIGEGNTFNAYGNFDGDASSVSGMGSDSANAPWRWENGLWLSDPAFFADGNRHFDEMSHKYTYNKYFSHKIVVNKIQAHVYKDPYNIFNKKTRKPDVFMRVMAGGTKFIDIGDWKVSNLDLNVWRDFNFGKDEAEGSRRFTEDLDTVYIARMNDITVQYEVRDRDSDADDSMGTVTKQIIHGTSHFFEDKTSSNEATINGELHMRVE